VWNDEAVGDDAAHGGWEEKHPAKTARAGAITHISKMINRPRRQFVKMVKNDEAIDDGMDCPVATRAQAG